MVNQENGIKLKKLQKQINFSKKKFKIFISYEIIHFLK
jgi:hypothetical protein